MPTETLEKLFIRLIFIGIPLGVVLVIVGEYVKELITPYLGVDASGLFVAFIAMYIFFAVFTKWLKEAVDERNENKK